MVNQQTLENKLNPHAVIFLSPRATLEEAFGPMEDWILEMGSYRLMLNPLNGYWVYEDILHGDWEATGFRAGDVIFYLEGDELTVKLNPLAPDREQDNRFDLAEDFFRRLKDKLLMGTMDPDTFSREVQALHLQDREGNWWQIGEADGSWLTWNGNAWVESSPVRRGRCDEFASLQSKFSAIKETYFALLKQLYEEEIIPDDFLNEVNNLRVQDKEGAWWQVHDQDGAWLKWDGAAWVAAIPVF